MLNNIKTISSIVVAVFSLSIPFLYASGTLYFSGNLEYWGYSTSMFPSSFVDTITQGGFLIITIIASSIRGLLFTPLVLFTAAIFAYFLYLFFRSKSKAMDKKYDGNKTNKKDQEEDHITKNAESLIEKSGLITIAVAILLFFMYQFIQLVVYAESKGVKYTQAFKEKVDSSYDSQMLLEGDEPSFSKRKLYKLIDGEEIYGWQLFYSPEFVALYLGKNETRLIPTPKIESQANVFLTKEYIEKNNK